VQQERKTAAAPKAWILRPELERIARLAFFAVLASSLYFAWSPAPPVVLGNDKSQHALAFFWLTALFRLAFPGSGWKGALIWMGLLGALIEVVQAIPALNRDCDIYDWLADMGAVLVGLVAAGVIVRLLGRPFIPPADR
jgi:VanZ family protein